MPADEVLLDDLRGVAFRPATPEDLGYVTALERDPENRAFICGWTREEHQAFLDAPGNAHWLILGGPDRERAGFVLLSGLDGPHRSVELKRIVVERKGIGLGRATLRRLKEIAFRSLDAHRLWLDVFETNERARHLYASEGFVIEGMLRECIQREGRFHSLVVMSVLAPEYDAARGGADGDG